MLLLKISFVLELLNGGIICHHHLTKDLHNQKFRQDYHFYLLNDTCHRLYEFNFTFVPLPVTSWFSGFVAVLHSCVLMSCFRAICTFHQNEEMRMSRVSQYL